MGPAIVKALGIVQKASNSPKAKASYESTLKYIKSLPGATPGWASRNLLKDPRFIKDLKSPGKRIRVGKKPTKASYG